MFFITQCFVYGWPEKLFDDQEITEKIRDGEVSWEVKDQQLLVEGVDFGTAPDNWETREENYNAALNYFL